MNVLRYKLAGTLNHTLGTSRVFVLGEADIFGVELPRNTTSVACFSKGHEWYSG